MRKIAPLLVLLSLAVSAPGCSWFSKKAEVAKQAALDCAKEDLGQTIAGLGISVLGAVVGLLASDDEGWKDHLAMVEKQVGEKALACALHVAEQLFRPDLSQPSTSAGADSPHTRAEELLKARGWRFE